MSNAMHCIGQTKITQIDRHISPFCWADFYTFGVLFRITDIITCVKF